MDRVPVPRTLGPVEHAAGGVEEIPAASSGPSGFVCLSASGKRTSCVELRYRWVAAEEPRALLVREGDVSHPDADGGLRDAQEAGKCLDRQALLLSKLPRQISLGCLHF